MIERRPGRRLLALFIAMVATLLAVPAAAHLTPNSEIRLHFAPGAVEAAVLIPASEYAYATGQSGDSTPAALAEARRYLLDHAAVLAPDGRAWAKDVTRINVVSAPGGPDMLATLRFVPPPGAPDRALRLRWDAVIRETPSHFALAAIDGDLVRGMSEGNELLGSFTRETPEMRIDRGTSGTAGLFGGAILLGARHILGGHDHLLFLLALLLPAPLLAAGGRWGAPRSPRATLHLLGWTVSAFTVGHSLTLIAAALFNAHLPAAPVEALIALSVLVSSLHGLRPLFPGREPLVALMFGLVHGLAFATVIAGFGVDAETRATAILGFNLGIELIQLGIVALLLPALLIGARTAAYPAARRGLATLAAGAALAWLAERVSDTPSPVAAAFDAVLPWLGLALVASSLVVGLAWLARGGLPQAAARMSA
ncbi:HupE/UreJ family protein [Novosphingobium tardum]|uniref:HupE/UreJ family protein n=1 Tax=Novosphingobium tardum TaxID=1538021 RepID=A0ABV8RQZ7_9SPHN